MRLDLSFLLASALLPLLCHSFACLDGKGAIHSWWLIRQIPEVSEPAVYRLGADLRKGTYFFLTEGNQNPTRFHPTKIQSQRNNPLMGTLWPFFGNGSEEHSEDTFLVTYNDRGFPQNDSGVSRGFVMYSQKARRGVWIIHSAEEFPNLFEEDGEFFMDSVIPPSMLRKGQTFLCLSFLEHELPKMVEILRTTKPAIVYSHVGDSVEEFLFLKEGSIGEENRETSSGTVSRFQIADGSVFDVFLKSGGERFDVYSNFVAPFYETDLVVQSSVLQPEFVDNVKLSMDGCEGQYKVTNVTTTAFGNYLTFDYAHLKDNSKYAITENGHVCIGDFDRKFWHLDKPGVVACTKSKRGVYSHFVASVQRTSSCRR
ncbi:hypothetical protein QR680_017792 [Steinernema hermaphroditum]|uniref:Uncharacterized protein n=1 Tax=Steinernema hermaphroditum TaxID=289476 RepID=A0AA39LPR8_9BILA|nr:hypothetical protein QR680_017792 [Steinernema hermaphroditum]